MQRAVYCWLFALSLVVVGPVACSTTTAPPAAGLVVIISTDMMPSEFDSIRVEVSQEEGVASGQWHKWLDETKSVPGEVTLSTSVFIQSGSAPDQDALIQVTALLLGQPVVLREAQLQIPTDRVAQLALVLSEACKGQVRLIGAEGEPMSTCPIAGQSCQPTGICGDTVVSSAELPTYMPGDVPLDSGLPSVGDAGETGDDLTQNGGPGSTLDAAADATVSTDSGAQEGSVTSGPDACANACTSGQTMCASGSVQTCQGQANGCTQWVTTACGPNRTCTVSGADAGAIASCTCSSSQCTEVGTVCENAQTLATCAKDTNGCLVGSPSPCPAGESCGGMLPNASCSTVCQNSCTAGQTSCVAGGLATCALGSNGCYSYGAPVACGTHQSCTAPPGSAACTCNADPVCSAVGSACASSTTLATCAKDAQGCVYESATSTCAHGACSAAACCTNTCTQGQTSCVNGQLATCALGSNGCYSYGAPVACGANATCASGSCNCNSAYTNCNGACVACAAGSLCAGQSCACASSAQCVPPAPNGWLGPVAADLAAQSACDPSYPTIVALGTNAQGTAASCSCQCGACSGGQCTVYADAYSDANYPNCTTLDYSDMIGTQVGDCFGPGLDNSALYSPRTVANFTGAVCGVTTLSTNKGAASWGVPSRVCTGAMTAAGACSGGETCAPSVGSAEKLCVYQSAAGALTCPAGYPVANVRYSNWSDTRACSCACSPSSAYCTTDLEFTSNACPGTDFSQVTACSTFSGLDSTAGITIYSLDLTVNGTTSYTTSGSVTDNTSSTVTICCTN